MKPGHVGPSVGGCVDTPNPYKDSGDFHDDIACYQDGKWSIVVSCPERRASGTSIEGSTDCFVFDPNTLEAERVAPLAIRRKKPQLHLQADGTVRVSSDEGDSELWSPSANLVVG